MDCVDFALACYRQPLTYQERLSLAAPLPDGMDQLLWLANGSPEAVETAMLLTGARPQELQDAARFCVQQLCFARGAGPYRLLGLEPGATPARIKEHHRLLMRLFHPDRAAGRETWTESYAARVNEAWTTLSRTPSPFAPDRPLPQSILTLDGFSAAPSPFADITDLPLPPPPVFAEPARRRRIRVPRQWLPGLVLAGLALAVTGVLGGWYLDKRNRLAIPATIPASADSVEPAIDSATTSTSSDQRTAITAFLAAPDWQTLEQREQQARQQADRVQENRQQLEQNHREQIIVEELALERMRVERAQLEEQLKAEQARVQQVKTERVAVEQQRLDRLKAEQTRLEQAKTERLAAERRRLEELQAEQAKAERLAEELRSERRRLEQTKAEQARSERAKAESARAEPLSVADPQEAERARTERLRLEAQLQAERAKAEQANTERLRLETQLQAEQAKTEQANTERLRLETQLQAEQATVEQVRLNVVTPDDQDLTVQDLDGLIERYTQAYERGDLGDIMALFAANARGKGGNDRNRIRQDYATLLKTHQVRQMRLQSLRWAYQGETASGSGRYQLQLQQRDNGAPARVEGNIRFKVRKQGRQALIEAIDYDWQPH